MSEKRNIPAIRFKGFTDAWEQRKLGELLDFLQNNTLSRSQLSSESGEAKNVHYGDVLINYGEVIDANCLCSGFIDDARTIDKFKESLLSDGDLIIADTAEDETVGKCTEIMNIGHQKVLSGLHTIPCHPRHKFATGYLGYYMNSQSYHAQLYPLMQGIKVTSISKSALQRTIICYPESLEEQRLISSVFMNMDTLITLHQRKVEKLKNLKSALLEKMFV